MQETPWKKLKPPVKSKCGAIQSLKLEVDIKRPSSPTSCSKEPQLWGQTTLLSVFSILFLKTCLPQYLILFYFFVNQFLSVSFLSCPLYWFCSVWRLFTIYRCCRIIPFGDDFAVTSCLWNSVHTHSKSLLILSTIEMGFCAQRIKDRSQEGYINKSLHGIFSCLHAQGDDSGLVNSGGILETAKIASWKIQFSCSFMFRMTKLTFLQI